MRREYLIVNILVLVLLFGCSGVDKKNKDSETKQTAQQTAGPGFDFSFEDAAVMLPSQADVQLDPGGRFYPRFQGNINYVRYQHDHYGEEMLEAFASRHYSPGKLLERMWDGEYAGKWLDAATRTAVNTGSDEQLAMVDSFAASLKKYQQPDGYMGIKLPVDRELNDWEQDWDIWNQWNSMIGFLTHYELRGDNTSLEAATGVGEWIVKAFSPVNGKNSEFLDGVTNDGFTNAVVIGQLVRLYRHTGNEDVLEFVGQVIQSFPPIQQMLSSGEPYLFHPYMLNAVLGGVLGFAQVTGDYEMLEKVEQVWDGLVRDHLYPTGSLGDREDLSGDQLEDTPGGQLQETCATTEWIFLTQSLFSITGKAKYLDALELTSHNALLAAQSADGMKWCYWTPLRHSKHWFHGPTRCCFWSGPRGIARLPQLIYATKKNIVYVNFFESSHATLSTDDGEVHITQDSKFPSTGISSVTLKTPPGWKGTVRIRVPGWSADFQAELNGNAVKCDTDLKGYSDISLQGSTTHKIGIQFEIPLVLEQFVGNDYVLRRGPEILVIDVRDNIDTWLGVDDLISLPPDITILDFDSLEGYEWPGPSDNDGSRRRYPVNVEDARTAEPRSVILTPYADAGNEGAAFRTVFPLAE